ncbi:uncharacterized protein YdiU (UPF0061 family) [Prosthecobacter fusiformis]|uniref:Protein nucleotidyltransferase YdiU n=1 Tax=Prosthecobacter fusiformis TaxID=48464 RepID=A0A4R7RXR9_9BACT|nr:YdiU family protein [Prosthecobacter fusiformis]TDU70660.1 uncharacterized protein YdiU (UPF0061 family) [Prosthecobacter fusiformis]
MPDPQSSKNDAGWHLQNTYSRLPGLLHVSASPVPVKRPALKVFNHELARELELNGSALDTQEGAEIFAGNRIPGGAEPLAQAYAGHQFGHFTTLGDGRAILLGEQLTSVGERYDIQLKGSGITPFSRRGDGRAALGPMLREYIISEAMHGLGIPTTRSLAVTTTGEAVYRPQPLPGAVLTRVAASHIRVGTFEWAAAHGDTAAVKALTDYTIARHYPEVVGSAEPYLAFLKAAIDRQAALIAKWLQVGFIHGVMNTDNMALSGETIDYGPCAFMDVYDPATVFSSIDRQGRYAYGNQPSIAKWNLARFAEALLPLLHADEEKSVELANEAIESFGRIYEQYWLDGRRKKLGLHTQEDGDRALIQRLLNWMKDAKADYTLTFRSLSADTPLPMDAPFQIWHGEWRARLARQPQSMSEVVTLMQAHNPAFIPRNHKVEEALAAAVERDDLSVMERLLSILKKPYDYSVDAPEYSAPLDAGADGYQTFCGT